MNPFVKLHHRPRSLRSLAALPMLLVFLGGCASSEFSDMRFDNFDWLTSKQAGPPETVVLARDPASLANASEVERTLYNAVELSRQKRFVEARYLLAEARSVQERDSDGYRAISCAMALLALREGDIGTFKRVARQLDTSLGQPVRVDSAYVDVISLYRAMNNRNLPVNANDKFKTLKQKYFGTRSAELRT